MTWRGRNVVAALCAVLVATMVPAASAQSVPITVRWEKVEPTSIKIVTPDGTRLLTKDVGGKRFTGQIATPQTQTYEPRIVLVDYNSQTFPLTVNVRKTARAVEFLVDREDVPSCAEIYVGRVEAPANNMDDAMRRMLTAAYMLSLPPPDRNCVDKRKSRTIQAQLARNQNLATTSYGLFGVGVEVRTALRDLPPMALPVGQTADLMLARADADAASAVAKGLYDDLRDTGDGRDYAAAAAIASDLASAVREDRDLATAFRDQGIDKDRLDADARFYANRDKAERNSSSDR